jgi:3-hydroxyacyl-[acyl-carrier-protein] dehydratase
MPTISNDIFSIKSIAHENGIILAVLKIDPNSEILKGHFPGHPVVPGASMLQTLKEVLEGALEQSLIMKKADSLKFMRIIDPLNTETVLLDIAYKFTGENMIHVSAKLSTGETMCFKFQGTFAYWRLTGHAI